MEENEIMDQAAVAQTVSDKIKYNFFDYFLVKPLDPIKVTKEFSKPVSAGTPAKDANGVEAQDFDNVETEVKEVDSDYRKGVVIKVPMFYNDDKIKVGDVVVFKEIVGLRFDLVRDSRLIRTFDILGVER
jgi:hypothetical protein